MRALKSVAAVCALAFAGCRAAAPPRPAPRPVTPQPPPLHLAQCTGPATSLPDSLARALPRRTATMRTDDAWANLARTTPGGFAGFFYDSTYTHILMLTQPARAAEAKRALGDQRGYPLADDVVVREARWDFAQLVDWSDYLRSRLSVVVGSDNDEVANRIRFSVMSMAARDSLVRQLDALHIPCDLVIVDLNGLIVRIG